MNPLKDVIAGLADPVAKIIADVADNKIQKGTALVQMQTVLTQAEVASDQAAASIIMAEAQGESWLQRSWRPLAALSFVALFMSFPIMFAFGKDPAPLGVALGAIPDVITNGTFMMVGGYIGLRSVEKSGALDTLKSVLTKGKK